MFLWGEHIGENSTSKQDDDAKTFGGTYVITHQASKGKGRCKQGSQSNMPLNLPHYHPIASEAGDHPLRPFTEDRNCPILCAQRLSVTMKIIMKGKK